MKKRVFILDDDEKILKLMERSLQLEGFEVDAKSVAMGTTNEIRKFRPGYVVLDIMMPDLSGDALVDLIQKNVRPKPKILFFSSKSREELARIAAEKGVDGFICKTEGVKALIEKIKSM